MKYLKGMKNLRIRYPGKGEAIECYCDASLGMNDEEGKSMTGYAMFIFGDLIMWRTKRQNHVALLSAEMVFVPLSLAHCDVICLYEMSKQLIKLHITSTMHENNDSD